MQGLETFLIECKRDNQEYLSSYELRLMQIELDILLLCIEI